MYGTLSFLKVSAISVEDFHFKMLMQAVRGRFIYAGCIFALYLEKTNQFLADPEYRLFETLMQYCSFSPCINRFTDKTFVRIKLEKQSVDRH